MYLLWRGVEKHIINPLLASDHFHVIYSNLVWNFFWKESVYKITKSRAQGHKEYCLYTIVRSDCTYCLWTWECVDGIFQTIFPVLQFCETHPGTKAGGNREVLLGVVLSGHRHSHFPFPSPRKVRFHSFWVNLRFFVEEWAMKSLKDLHRNLHSFSHGSKFSILGSVLLTPRL